MADVSAAGPFAERHLGHQFRLDPMHPFRLPAADGFLVGFEGGQRLVQRNQPLAVKAGADLARIAQGAVVFMHG
ncbi:hypothetical protein D3C71_1875280 [compost metagenome]